MEDSSKRSGSGRRINLSTAKAAVKSHIKSPRLGSFGKGKDSSTSSVDCISSQNSHAPDSSPKDKASDSSGSLVESADYPSSDRAFSAAESPSSLVDEINSPPSQPEVCIEGIQEASATTGWVICFVHISMLMA